jgi:hypothetical protein
MTYKDPNEIMSITMQLSPAQRELVRERSIDALNPSTKKKEQVLLRDAEGWVCMDSQGVGVWNRCGKTNSGCELFSGVLDAQPERFPGVRFWKGRPREWFGKNRCMRRGQCGAYITGGGRRRH